MLNAEAATDTSFAIKSFRRGHKLALKLLSSAKMLPAEVDRQLAGANLHRLALEAGDLSASATAAESTVDVQASSTPELELLIPPVQALQARLAELLEEWPDNPLLEQLKAICSRLLGMPLTEACMPSQTSKLCSQYIRQCGLHTPIVVGQGC